MRRLRAHSELRGKARAIGECSTSWKIAVNIADPSKSRPTPTNHCRDRLCPRCQSARARKWIERVKPMLEHLAEGEKRPAKFITLTQRSRVGESLRAARARFERSFRKLYLHPEWKKHVAGYLASREVTWSNGAWHYHVHVFADSEYWPQAELSQLWETITGDSRIVDIRAAEAGDEREVIKYALKVLVVPTDRLLELVRAMFRVRMISTGGTWRALLRDRDLEPDDCPEGCKIVPAQELYSRAQAGDPIARTAIAAVLRWAEERGPAALEAVCSALLRPHIAVKSPPNELVLYRFQMLGLEPWELS